eukprot:2899849-Prymnesium_polylepis.1
MCIRDSARSQTSGLGDGRSNATHQGRVSAMRAPERAGGLCDGMWCGPLGGGAVQRTALERCSLHIGPWSTCQAVIAYGSLRDRDTFRESFSDTIRHTHSIPSPPLQAGARRPRVDVYGSVVRYDHHKWGGRVIRWK